MSLRSHVHVNEQPSNTLSLAKMIDLFRDTLRSRRESVIQEMWDAMPALQAWYRGESVNFGTEQKKDLRTISLNELEDDFTTLLFSKAITTIEAMWKGNSAFQQWYKGQHININTMISSIATDKLIIHFAVVFQCPAYGVIRDFWDGNIKLHADIKALPADKSILTLKSILHNRRACGDMMTQYLDCLDKSIIRAVIEEIKTDNKHRIPPPYITKQIEHLEDYLSPEKQFILSSTFFDYQTEIPVFTFDTDSYIYIPRTPTGNM